METRLRAKRKEKDKETAKLESQVLTRSAAKKARAAGIPSPLLKDVVELATLVTGARSQRKPRIAEEEVKQEGHPVDRASARSRLAGRERGDPQTDPRQAAERRECRQAEAGPSAPRPDQRVAPPGDRQGEADMDRRRREEQEAAQARDGAEEEVRACMTIEGPVTSRHGPLASRLLGWHPASHFPCCLR